MSLKRKDFRANIRSSSQLSPHHYSSHLSPQILRIDPNTSYHENASSPLDFSSSNYNAHRHKSIIDDRSITGISHHNTSVSPKIRTKLPAIHNKSKSPNELFLPCKRHSVECLKFVDVGQTKFEGLCDICMVSPEFVGRSMKLERLVDIYERKRRDLIKTQEDLKDLEAKIAKIHKEIIKTNSMTAPIIRELEEMEKKVTKEVEKCFKKLQAKFIKFNPFKDTRELIKIKIAQSEEIIERLSEGTQNSFAALQSLYLNESKIINENRELVKDIESRIQINTMTDPLQEKDFNLLAYEFERFFEKLEGNCRQFSQVVKVRT